MAISYKGQARKGDAVLLVVEVQEQEARVDK